MHITSHSSCQVAQLQASSTHFIFLSLNVVFVLAKEICISFWSGLLFALAHFDDDILGVSF